MRESKEGQTRQGFQSTQAYKYDDITKTPEEVAIVLNLRQPQVTEFYTEHWKLKGLYMLNQIYQENKDDFGYFVRLYRLAKSARMDARSVIRLLEIANNDLQSVEYRCERRKRDLDSLEADNRNSARLFQELTDQIATMRKRLDSTRLDYEKEMVIKGTNCQ